MTGPARDTEDLASHYVTGLLDATELAEAEHLMQTDPSFAKAVERWRARLAPLDLSAEPMTPPHALWQRIADDIAAPAQPRRRAWSHLWDSVRLWRAAALVATAATLVFAVAFGVALREAQRQPAMIAVLIDGTRAGAVVHIFADGRATLLPLTDIPVPADRVLEVWTLPSRERGPVSVGLLQQARSLTLALQGLPAPKADQLFEITLEPKGGSPIGRPTGPILFKGLASPTL